MVSVATMAAGPVYGYGNRIVEAGTGALRIQEAIFHLFILAFFIVLVFLRVLVFFRVPGDSGLPP